MRILHITSEVAPWAGTGGLADVCGSLPEAQKKAAPKSQIAVFAPLYREIWHREQSSRLYETGVEFDLEGPPHKSGRIFGVDGQKGAQHYFVDCPEYYDRNGIYDDPIGWVHGDNAMRFALLCRAALETAPLVLGGIPDVVHVHDWPGALALLYMRRQYRFAYANTKAILSIHNLGYQGEFGKEMLPHIGMSWADFVFERFEFHDRLNLLKGGIALADAVVAPSPTYAEEILTREQGHGLDGHLVDHSFKLYGILNGIDEDAWNPETDPHIAANYTARDRSDKAECRRALVEEFGLDAGDDTPVIGVVSRLAWQKGLDLLADVAPRAVEMGARVALVGSGNRSLAERWRWLSEAHPGRISAKIAFDPALAHRVEAGADAFCMPSRYEPCGLNQMYSMRYGTIPIVHEVGGLKDTVIDFDAKGRKRQANGVTFDHHSYESLSEAIRRAITCFRDDPKRWQRMMVNGMKRDCSWGPSARDYLLIYAGKLDR